jgi:hypothetical protein
MPTPPIHLDQLSSAVQSAVEQALAKHGAVSIDKLWFGFVAPDAVATQENANKIAASLGKIGGVQGAGSVAQISAAAGTHTEGLTKPGHIIGIVYVPKAVKS